MISGRSRIDIKDGSPSVPSVQSLEYDVVLMEGVTEWGPLEATEITSFAQFQEIFGGYISGRQAPVQAQVLFDMGVHKIIFGRVVHMSGSSPASAAKASHTAQTSSGAQTTGTVTGTVAAPFALDNGETLVVSVDGGADQTATFSAVAASMTSGEAETYALSDGDTLVIRVDGGSDQTVTFSAGDFVDITKALASEVAAVIQTQVTGVSASASGGKVTVTSLRKGTASSIQAVQQGGGVYGTDANSELHFPVTAQTGSGDCANHNSVTLSEVKTWAEAAIVGITVGSSGSYLTIATNTAGAAGSIQVQPVSTADTPLGLDNDLHVGKDAGAQDTLKISGKYYGAKGNRISYIISDATDGVASHFDLAVYLDGVFQTKYTNKTMDPSSTDYIVTAVNTDGGGSKLIEVTDMNAGGTVLERRPANNSSAQVLSGGADGLSGLDYNDFLGSETYRTGLYRFLALAQGDILLCPDETSTSFQNGAISWCEDQKKGKVIFVPETPASSDKAAAVSHAQALTPSEKATGVYWPWIKISNPDKSVYGQSDTITIAPSGAVVGRYVKNSSLYREKMAKQPGNATYGALDVAVDVETAEVNDPSVRDYVTPKRVNPIVADIDPQTGSFGVWMDDVMSLKGTGNWKSVGQIRFVAYVKKVIAAYLDGFRTQGMSPHFRYQIKSGITAWLLQWLGDDMDVFASAKASEAFYVETDVEGTGLNNPQVQANEQFKVIVGLALAEAGRFGELTITKDDRAFQTYVQKALAGSA